MVKAAAGAAIGAAVGAAGRCVGCAGSAAVGWRVGAAVGLAVGAAVIGAAVGACVRTGTGADGDSAGSTVLAPALQATAGLCGFQKLHLASLLISRSPVYVSRIHKPCCPMRRCHS